MRAEEETAAEEAAAEEAAVAAAGGRASAARLPDALDLGFHGVRTRRIQLVVATVS
jgi:hypothetical protein